MDISPYVIDPTQALPRDRPFTRREARALGVPDQSLCRAVASGLLQHPMRGVYFNSELDEDLTLRIMCTQLVVPPDAVVTDRTAAWLLGAPRVLAPGDHLVVPKLSVFRKPGYRLRNALSTSGERTFRPGDVMEVGGVKVTTPLRTALDVGRLLHRDQALGVMDALQKVHGFTNDDLARGARDFKGARGVVQLRELSPYVDGRSGSPSESVCRSKWLQMTSVPRPQVQIEVPAPHGFYYLDLGVPKLKYALEYDGEEFHDDDQADHDRERRAWIRGHGGWLIDVVRKEDVFGVHADVEGIIFAGIRAARERMR